MNYSVIKYGTNTKASIAKFNSLSRDQQYKFDWLSTRFAETQDLVYACIACEFDDIDIRYAQKEDIIDSFFKFKSRRESMTYKLNSQLSSYNDLENKSLDKLILKYFIGVYCPEFILSLVYNTDQLDVLYNDVNFSWAKLKLLKLMKYTDFFNSKKFNQLLICV